jgi:hypothetical protein
MTFIHAIRLPRERKNVQEAQSIMDVSLHSVVTLVETFSFQTPGVILDIILVAPGVSGLLNAHLDFLLLLHEFRCASLFHRCGVHGYVRNHHGDFRQRC